MVVRMGGNESVPPQNGQVERALCVGDKLFQVCLTYTSNGIDVRWRELLKNVGIGKYERLIPEEQSYLVKYPRRLSKPGQNSS